MFDVFNMAARRRKIGIPGKKTRDKVIQQSVEQRKTKAFDRLKEMQETGDQETKDMVSNLFQDLKNLKDIPTHEERLEKLADILNDNVFADTLTATPPQTGAESEIIDTDVYQCTTTSSNGMQKNARRITVTMCANPSI